MHKSSTTSTWRTLALALALFTLTSASLPVLASEMPTEMPASLDLASTSKTAIAPSSLAQPVEIEQGNFHRTVTAGMPVTPAQLLAVNQILSGTNQSRTLSANGAAIAGTVELSGSHTFSAVNIPRGVTVLSDFTTSSLITVTGNLINSGTLSAFSSSDSAGITATIAAANITNNRGALIQSTNYTDRIQRPATRSIDSQCYRRRVG